MSYLKKPKVRIYEPQKDPNDPRIKNIIKPWDNLSTDVIIVGAPFDYAITLGGGRRGAAKAPEAIRNQLKKYGTTFNIDRNINLEDLKVSDAGNVKVAKRDVHKTHARIEEVLTNLLKLDFTIIVLGGGHDITYANVKALKNVYSEVGGINFDSHFDVREVVDNKITSGTPFRRLLEEKIIEGKNFVEMGSHDNLNSKNYLDYLHKKRANIIYFDSIRRSGIKLLTNLAFSVSTKHVDAAFCSIDIDCMAQCYAPGCSAPDSHGLNPEQIREAAYLVGANKKVKLLDIVEVNPKYDIDERTSRLAASIIISFLNGVKKRK